MFWPEAGQEVWELNTRVQHKLLGEVVEVTQQKLTTGVTGSTFPIWQVKYLMSGRYARRKGLTRLAWVVGINGRLYYTDGQEV